MNWKLAVAESITINPYWRQVGLGGKKARVIYPINSDINSLDRLFSQSSSFSLLGDRRCTNIVRTTMFVF